MEEASSTVSALDQFSGCLHERGERANVELCPQTVLPFYLTQYWKISIHSFSLLFFCLFFFPVDKHRL